ncbi:type II toxin-antitoxin system HicB family antitoxin [Thiospirillum jenense]|uniref:type II toxin-antitoxin system HicB family antitoxin n=1 Tax=Thiospirillum jenense TaxID=1653858 RepID=UPI001931C5B7|nr:type II toxin-antitoxin system HicB family antitoxin [Thiospirillum jenense]
MNLKIILEASDEGGFTAFVPALPGCISEGDTRAEADTFFLSISEQCSVTLNCQSEDWGVSTKAAKTDVFTARTL